MEAYRLAVEQGADAIELDVHLTADGELAVIHDETLERTTDGSGAVVGHTMDQIRALDAGATVRRRRWIVPASRDAVSACRACPR